MLKQVIGIIGYGNMGSAIADKLKENYRVMVFDKIAGKAQTSSGIEVADSVEKLVENSSVIIFAVKPQDFNQLLVAIKNFIGTKLIISIAAGIPTSYIEKLLGKARIIRVMPNLAAVVGKSMTCICKGTFSSAIDLNFVQLLFGHIGATLIIEERLMDAATAVAGSGPGFFFDLIKDLPREQWEEFGSQVMIPKMHMIGQKLGFNSDQSWKLAEMTVKGSIAMLLETKASPEILRIRVTSKGGTTETGLQILQSKLENLEQAVMAAKKRSEELAKKE